MSRDVYGRFQAYPFDTDERFLSGLKWMASKRDIGTETEDNLGATGQTEEDVCLKAKLFYYAK